MSEYFSFLFYNLFKCALIQNTQQNEVPCPHEIYILMKRVRQWTADKIKESSIRHYSKETDATEKEETGCVGE